MMNQVERIVIERKGAIFARINMLDANDRVINTIKTTEMLAYDDYTIDRETIAELCGMTLDTLNRFYYLDSTGYSKVIDYGVILTEAEFTKKNKFDILYDAIQNGDIKIADDEDDYEDYYYDDEPEEEVIVEVPKEEPVMVPNNNMVIAKIQEQMIKALEEGDFETYDKLEERLNRLNK